MQFSNLNTVFTEIRVYDGNCIVPKILTFQFTVKYKYNRVKKILKTLSVIYISRTLVKVAPFMLGRSYWRSIV